MTSSFVAVNDDKLDVDMEDKDFVVVDDDFDTYSEKLVKFSKAKLNYLGEKRKYNRFLNTEFKDMMLKKTQWKKLLDECKKEYKLSDSEFKKVSNIVVNPKKL
jgi:hypothetical protein